MTGSNSFGHMKPTLKKPLDGENAVHLHIHIYKKSAKTGMFENQPVLFFVILVL